MDLTFFYICWVYNSKKRKGIYMNQFELQYHENVGTLTIDNFEDLKAKLSESLKRYENIAYTEESMAMAKEDKKTLNTLRRNLVQHKRDAKKEWMEPYNSYESQINELIDMIDQPLGEIKGFLTHEKNKEKSKKTETIYQYMQEKGQILGGMADTILQSPAFFDDKWLYKSTTASKWRKEVDAKLEQCCRDLQHIQTMPENQQPLFVNEYLKNLSTEGFSQLKDELDNLSDTMQSLELDSVETKDYRQGYKVIKINGNMEQINQAMEYLSFLGLDIEELEDGTPQKMHEICKPDFASFVAFDIETSGSFGIANGDGPAEITEIGAVKVENGKIVDRFTQLVNPGRKIVPRVARLTHITDQLVKNEPYIDTVIQDFAKFVGNSILIGHNIKYSDLPYIQKAAYKAGVILENAYFDTYLYAKQFKNEQHWDNVTLTYLSKYFHIEQEEAHRAWCDAQANAGVYFELKKLK